MGMAARAIGCSQLPISAPALVPSMGGPPLFYERPNRGGELPRVSTRTWRAILPGITHWPGNLLR